jgi:transposase
MLDVAKSLPEDPDELRQFTALLLAEVKLQAVLIEKLRHQLAGHRHHRFGSSSESIEQLQLALETSEISVAKMTAKLRLPDEEPKDKPKRRPIPDHIPRMEVELTTGDEDCTQCGGALRRLGQDVTEELEYVPPSCLMIFGCPWTILGVMRRMFFAVHWRGGSHPSWSLWTARE